jgi:hypothetical protein
MPVAVLEIEEDTMARVVEEFPVQPTHSKYPWQDWLNGQVWELIPGEDFQGKPATFRSVAIGQAKKRGGKVRTSLFRAKQEGEKDRLYVQFVNGSEAVGSRQATGYGS